MDSKASPGEIRILRIITRLNVGGPARQAVSLTRCLDRPPFRSLCVAGDVPAWEGDWTRLAEGLGLSFRSVPEVRFGSSPIRAAAALRRLGSIIETFRPHVVHTHESHAGLVGRVASFRRRVPVVVHTHHGHVLRGYFSRPVSALIASVERRLARRTDALVVPAKEIADELAAVGLAERSRLVVVPPGVDVEPMLNAPLGPDLDARSKLGIEPNALVAGFVGRLVPVKDPMLMLDAVGELARTIPSFRLVVAGDGPMRRAVETRAAALLPSSAVRMLGFRDDVATVFRSLDVMLLSSRAEGLPTALIESMACGVPAVATRVGGVPGLVEDGVNGILVEPGDARGLARGAALLLGDAARRRSLAGAARDSIARRDFGVERMSTDLASLYRDLLEKKGQAALDPRPGEPS